MPSIDIVGKNKQEVNKELKQLVKMQGLVLKDQKTIRFRKLDDSYNVYRISYKTRKKKRTDPLTNLLNKMPFD